MLSLSLLTVLYFCIISLTSSPSSTLSSIGPVSLCCLTLSGASAIRVSTHRTTSVKRGGKKAETHKYIFKKKNKKKRNYNSLPQDLTVADVCLTSVAQQSRGGILGETLVKISHMFSPSPLFLRLSHSVCADPLMSVSQVSCSHRRSLAFDCLFFSGPDTGGSLREVKCERRREKKKKTVECSEGIH